MVCYYTACTTFLLKQFRAQNLGNGILLWLHKGCAENPDNILQCCRPALDGRPLVLFKTRAVYSGNRVNTTNELTPSQYLNTFCMKHLMRFL
uniref:Uncharacterized protein n=1 Tax=Arundo donax TaxID=35708 RepID=A0A0A9G8U1_ARUDO